MQPAPTIPPILVVVFVTHIFGLDRRSGAIVWRQDVPGHFRIDVSADRVILLAIRELRRIDLATGAVSWSVKLPMTQGDTLLCDYGQILVGGMGEMACYSEAGQLMWHNPMKGAGMATHMVLGVPGRVADYGKD